MDRLIEKDNLSQRTAAAQLAKVVEDRLGYPLYLADTLRKRYQRHTNRLGRNVPPTKAKDKLEKNLPPERKTTVKKPPEIEKRLKQLKEDMRYMAYQLKSAKTYLESIRGLESEVQDDFVKYGLRLKDAVLALFPEEKKHTHKVAAVK
jgi:hypothetical protein